MSNDFVRTLTEYIEAKAVRERNRGALGWAHTDLFRSRTGAKEVVIVFVKKMYDIAPRDLCVHYLYCGVLAQDQESIQDLLQQICLTSPFEVSFEEELGDGSTTDADLDEITEKHVMETARALAGNLSKSDRADRLDHHAAVARAALPAAVGAETAKAIIDLWL